METKWGLTEEELETAVEFSGFAAAHSWYEATRKGVEAGVKATLHHVYEEGDKPCPHSIGEDKTLISHQGWKKWNCYSCWQDLKQEAGL